MTEEIRTVIAEALHNEPAMGVQRDAVLAAGRRKVRRRHLAGIGGAALGVVAVTSAAVVIAGHIPAERGDARPPGGTAPPAVSITASPTATTPKSVADYFTPPQPYPGPTWTKNGHPVNGRELNSIAGPDHCGWQSAVMMHLGWPLGTISQTSAEIRQFIRDPNGVIDHGLRDKLAIAIDLPPDAEDTGYRNGELELWLRPSDPDAAYLRVGDDVERWPRADPVIACA